MSNNVASETWYTDYNFYVTDMIVSPTTIGMNKKDYSIQRDVSISAIAGFTNTTNNPTANAVPVNIERYSKPIGQDWKYDGIVYSKNHNLSDGSNTTIQHIDKNVSFGRNEAKQYVIKVNGGKSGVQKYTQETRRDDNEMFEEVKSIWKPDNPNPTDFVCQNGNHLKNTWSTEFSYRKVHSGVPKKRWIPPYSYTTGDPPYTVNVAGYWHYYCDPSPTYDPYKYETRTFTEEFGVKAVMFKTSDDPVERNILTSSKNTVRAGQSFDLYVVVEYKTNRDQMPWGHLPVGSGFQYLSSPSPVDGWTCNYERRNPNYSMVTSIPDIRASCDTIKIENPHK